MNFGWWTPLCEAWFQIRLKEIRSGKAKLRTPAKWTSFMRTAPAKVAKKIHKNYEPLAAQFLKSM